MLLQMLDMKIRRTKVKHIINGKDLMASFQLKCGCIFGECEGEKGILYCSKHQTKKNNRQKQPRNHCVLTVLIQQNHTD